MSEWERYNGQLNYPMERLGFGCTPFNVWIDKLDDKHPPYADKGMTVKYMGKECLVLNDALRVGERKQICVRLKTNDPDACICVYDASKSHHLSYMGYTGVHIKKPIMTGLSNRMSKEDMLKEKFEDFDLPENFTLGELEELDKYVNELMGDE